MNLIKCILTANDCYKTGKTIIPKGVMVHSTGANNPNIRRYVQPNIEGIGKNIYSNHWNRAGLDKCVHAFIGKLADGSIATVQTLPWNHRGWHAGSGRVGSANDTHISFEICEDGLKDKTYFDKVYKEAVELTAMLCKEYDLDPMKDGVVICHSEGYKRGIASGHADVLHWWPKHNKDMDDFRKDVLKEMEEEEMTQEQFNQMMDVWMKQQGQKPPAAWSETARNWAEEIGLIAGDGKGNMMYCAPVTREQLVQLLYRLENEI